MMSCRERVFNQGLALPHATGWRGVACGYSDKGGDPDGGGVYLCRQQDAALLCRSGGGGDACIGRGKKQTKKARR